MACNDPSHSHTVDDGIEYSLNRFIDTGVITCLNEKVKNSVQSIFKSWEDRHDTKYFLESCDDEELIINIPFGAVTQLKSIIIIGGDGGSAPSKLKAYTNNSNIDFGNIGSFTCAQEWNLHEDFEGAISYSCKPTKFNNMNHLTLYFPTNFGSPTTKIYYIGLKGVYTNARREIVNTVYEAKPQISDHKADSGANFVSRDLM
ncbi:hypothetical protein DICPUDRAFT_79966 [Dictyostelium purpureum]|uniref:PITH domain-containing protein n=1 Tax=Dictyostelium purpureum TaxID=5786 RepID=F0ZP57_DICPU|nr:uncharacterized protein DICPUDRAFT_79966 [Dictyostelium purpureum]EGC34268.1 hypothetical protein DICPUDRAFT_79966 [Dictyostelium purpureum]|eukprot:XP_003289197.1 hypothetical protein DICPUDRAFT_79966 [Dictyostelium purpureum]